MTLETPSPFAIAKVYGLNYAAIPSELSLEGAAELIGCSAQAVQAAINRGSLPATSFRIRRYSSWRVRRDDLLVFLWNRSTGPSPRGGLPHVRHIDPVLVNRRLKAAAREEAEKMTSTT
jgi:hypothetical protein